MKEPRRKPPTNRPLMRKRYEPVVDVLRKAFGSRLKAVVLFGSQAREAATATSDHDLFVVIEGLPCDRLARHALVRGTLLPVLDQLPGPIAFALKTPDEFEANLTPLLLDICLEGICLHGRAFFEPYRRKALKAVRQSGLRRTEVGNTMMWVLPRFPTNDWELTWEGYRELQG